MNLFETFVQLHQNSKPLLLGNTWDVNSAKLYATRGYKAIGVSSQAAANSLGYDDGENMPFELLLQLAKRVVELVHIPFSVDLEGGYSRTVAGITENIKKLHDIGVVGINLEDSLMGKTRQLQSVTEFGKILLAVAENLSQNNHNMFLNVRTDSFLLGMATALPETLTRLNVYKNSGANGIFVPCIVMADHIQQVVQATELPINVMCMPKLPNFADLEILGVKRISMGPFLFNKVNDYANQLANEIFTEQSFLPIFS